MVKLKRWFWAWDLDIEKDFLESKAKEGLVLAYTKLGSYYFEESEPKDLVYEMDFRIGTDKISEEEYLQIYEDAGWTFVTSISGWYYFSCEREAEGNHSIFNDNASRTGIYRRLLWFLCITGFPLYYQTLVMFPAINTQIDWNSFIGVIQIVMAVIMILHASVLIKIVFEYIKLRNTIKE